MGTVATAAAERATGGRPSRFKSLLAATIVGFTAAATTYGLLRRGGDADEDEDA